MLNFVAKVHSPENADYLEKILIPHILIYSYITLDTMHKIAECTEKIGTREIHVIVSHSTY